jgi:DNA mismatch endonuclease (patch repair protein)
MRGNRRRDTTPELALRRGVHALGLRYRVDAKPLPDLNRRADLVFTRAKVAVFLDGCYWHGCPEHGTIAKTNEQYWSPKIAGNRRRDADTDRRLVEAGWLPLRVWEHENVGEASQRVLALVRGRL